MHPSDTTQLSINDKWKISTRTSLKLDRPAMELLNYNRKVAVQGSAHSPLQCWSESTNMIHVYGFSAVPVHCLPAGTLHTASGIVWKTHLSPLPDSKTSSPLAREILSFINIYICVPLYCQQTVKTIRPGYWVMLTTIKVDWWHCAELDVPCTCLSHSCLSNREIQPTGFLMNFTRHT